MTRHDGRHAAPQATVYATFPRQRGLGVSLFAFAARHFSPAHDALADTLRDVAERALGGHRG